MINYKLYTQSIQGWRWGKLDFWDKSNFSGVNIWLYLNKRSLPLNNFYIKKVSFYQRPTAKSQSPMKEVRTAYNSFLIRCLFSFDIPISYIRDKLGMTKSNFCWPWSVITFLNMKANVVMRLITTLSVGIVLSNFPQKIDSLPLKTYLWT